MQQELKENGGLPASLLWTLAIVAGISVANIYYIQPLLDLIRADLGISEFRTNLIAMTTQAGYALGLFFIIPLGDLWQRKRIILANFSLLVLALLAIAWVRSLPALMTASLLTGACSVTPQIFIPIASQFSRPENKARNVGIVLSGLLTGVLASRVLSGLVGDALGWRAMYLIAAGLMLGCGLLVIRMLPPMKPNYAGSYAGLMKSLGRLLKTYPQLLVYSLRAALCFGSMLAMWSSLAFKMARAPFHASSDVVGLLGLCGVAGALTASNVGQYVPRLGVRRFNFIGCALMLAAWLAFSVGANTYAGLIPGIVLLDIGMQCIQLSNQSSVFNLEPAASNRINTIFMTTYFIGGSLGTFLSGAAWKLAAWPGVVAVGALLAAASLLITLGYKAPSDGK
ncbi:MAG: MFS transporter [Tannerella sp.]|jgi:predicted MFS family arabinose efflux permease|nr:MFS transporter [Tannerella sp.]